MNHRVNEYLWIKFMKTNIIVHNISLNNEFKESACKPVDLWHKTK